MRGGMFSSLRTLAIAIGLLNACHSDAAGPAPPVASQYKIDIRFFGRSLTSSQQALFNNAAAKMARIIVGNVPPVDASNADPASCGATGVPKLTETVQGVIIYASIDSIDGPANILAEAGPCYIRTNNGQNDYRTSIGIIRLDSADIGRLTGAGSLQDVITHEMMHVVGFGSFWDSTAMNLLINYGPNVSYVGAGGIAGCKAIGGANTCANSVPVEGTRGAEGTINSHWRESTFGNELMTGFINSGTNPLSVMSVRSLEDLHYTVNAAAADPYPDSHTIPTISLRADEMVGAPPASNWERPPSHAPRALPTVPGYQRSGGG
jgi:hypothetical protein